MLLKKRPLLFFALAFLPALAIGGAFAELFMPTVFMAVAVSFTLVGAIGLVIFIKATLTKRLVGVAFLFFLAILIFGSGLLSFAFYEKGRAIPIDDMDKTAVELKGRVIDSSLDTENNARYTIELESIEPFGERLTGRRLYLFAKGDTLFSYGDLVFAKARLSLPVKGHEASMKEQSVYINAFASGLPVLIKKADFSIIGAFKGINSYLCKRTDLLLEKPFSQLVKAMLLGDTSELDVSLSTIFMRGGLSHIFSVSGMHISIIASLLMALLTALLVPTRIKNPIVIIATWCLVLITGVKLPALRAGAMMSISLISPFFKRESEPINSLCIIAIFVGLFNPFALVSLSFLLTAFSTSGILLFTKRVAFGLKAIFKKAPSFILESLCVTLCANVAILPISVLFFKGISLASPITNLLLLPILPLLFLLCILLLIFGGIPFINQLLSALVSGLLKLLTAISQLLTDNGIAYLGLDFPFTPLWVFGCLIIGILCFSLFYKREDGLLKRRYFSKMAPSLFKSVSMAFLVLVGFLGVNSFLYRDTLEILPVASKEGITVVIKRRNTANVVVIKSDPQNDKQVLNLLGQKGITAIDAFVALDSKNSFSKERELIFRYFKTDKLLYPAPNGRLFGDGYGQSLKNNLFAFSIMGENAALTKTDEMTVLYTADVNIAKNFSCDILIFGGDFEKIVEHSLAKCVIILDELLYDTKPFYIRL